MNKTSIKYIMIVLVVIAYHALLIRSSYDAGLTLGRLELSAERIKNAELSSRVDKALISAAKANDEVKERIVTKTITKIQTIRAKERVVIKEVPTYVTVKSDNDCIVPIGFQLHWNKANKMCLSYPTGCPDDSADPNTDYDAPSEIKLRDIAEQHAAEVAQCTISEEQLMGLQDYIIAVSNGGK